MVERVRELGGEVKLRRRVSEIVLGDAREVRGVRTEGGEEYFAPLIVSCAHPKVTVRLLPDTALRPSFRRRLSSMEDGPSVLSVFATTKVDLSAHGQSNFFHYETLDLDALYNNLDRRQEFAFVTVPTAREGATPSGLHQVTGLGFLDWRRVAQWQGTRSGERGPEYEDFKQEQGEDLMRLVCEVIPELRGRVEKLEIATPLTLRDYAASEGGAAYGIHHTTDQSGRYGLCARTRVAGLFLTGQSVLLPGVCGVTISAFHTCATILGDEYLMRKVHAAA